MNEDAKSLYFNRQYKGETDYSIPFRNFVQKLISYGQLNKCHPVAAATSLSS